MTAPTLPSAVSCAPVTCPPLPLGPGTAALPAQLATSSLMVLKAAAVEGIKYWKKLPRRGFPPVTAVTDLARWVQVMTDRRPPRWATEHTIVFETPVARLRDFSDPEPGDVVPTLFLPPQAGHDSCIVDFSPKQSQIKVAKAAGLTRLYSMDWVGATPEHHDARVEDYLAVLDRAVEHMGGRANLVGDCQGGWLATIWAALNPEKVHTLTIAGAPVDFTIGQPSISTWVSVMGGNDLSAYRGIVQRAGGVMPGRHMLNGFITLKPESEAEKQFQLLSHLDDEDYLARYREFEDWFKHTQDIPGPFYLWIIEHLFRDNKLVRGELEIGGRTVDLSKITCPVNLLGGATDHITLPAQVFAAADHVGTPAEDITKATTSGGHLGLFMGSEALRHFWPPILTDVARRSRRSVPGEERARDAVAPHDPLLPAP